MLAERGTDRRCRRRFAARRLQLDDYQYFLRHGKTLV
jgi:hypothetical protein